MQSLLVPGAVRLVSFSRVHAAILMRLIRLGSNPPVFRRPQHRFSPHGSWKMSISDGPCSAACMWTADSPAFRQCRPCRA